MYKIIEVTIHEDLYSCLMFNCEETIIENNHSFTVIIEQEIEIPKEEANSYKIFELDGADLLIFTEGFEIDKKRIESDYIKRHKIIDFLNV